MDSLKNNTVLTTLNLSGNAIKDVGAKELAEALKTNTVLTKLDLCDNGITNMVDIEYRLKENRDKRPKPVVREVARSQPLKGDTETPKRVKINSELRYKLGHWLTR